jgi:hypothetical protein
MLSMNSNGFMSPQAQEQIIVSDFSISLEEALSNMRECCRQATRFWRRSHL